MHGQVPFQPKRDHCGWCMQGWWHYAVALDVSITVMQNFYHAPTNAKGLLALVLQSLARAKGVNPAQLLMKIRAASGQGAEHCNG